MSKSRSQREVAFHAGLSVMDITPPVGYRLQGHAARKKSSEGVHDPLFLKVMTLRQGERRIALVTADVIGFDDGFARDVWRRAERRLGMAARDIMLAGSHTHTGPVIKMGATFVQAEHILPDYIGFLKDKIIGGIIEASHCEAPVTLRWAQDRVSIGAINRRLWTGTEALTQPNPNGPVDDQLDLLRVDREDGSPFALLFRYGCHPTNIGPDIALISADYPGVAQRLVETAHPGATAMFMLGCAGDVRPANVRDGRFVGGTFQNAERMGRLLAAGVLRLAESAETVAPGGLHTALRRVSLPLDASRQPISLLRLAELTQAYERENREYAEKGYIQEWHDHWRGRIRAGKPLTRCVPLNMHAVRIGDVTLLALGTEAMAEYGDAIREAIGGRVMVPNMANGDSGYVPTSEAVAQGGYEAVFHLFENVSAPFAPHLQEYVLRHARELARSCGA